MYNAGDRKDIRKAEKEAAKAEALRLAFLRNAMSTLEGRAWFLHLLSTCHLFADPFTGDALIEAYSKGERNIGLQIYADIVRECPNFFILMMQEETERERRANAEHSRSADSRRDVEGRDAFDSSDGDTLE